MVSVDLDRTMWTEDFPHFGRLYPFAIETVNAMLEEGYEVVLWTARGGDNLDDCVDNLFENGLNINHPKFKVNEHSDYNLNLYSVQSPKVNCDVLLDDKAYNAPIYENYWHILFKEFMGKDIRVI